MQDIFCTSNWIFSKFALIYHLEKPTKWFDSDDLDIIFKVTGGLNYVKISGK